MCCAIQANSLSVVASGKKSEERKGAGIISHFKDQQMAGKLMAMGVLPGSRIEPFRKAPFGGGWYVRVDNLLLALREEELDSIVLK